MSVYFDDNALSEQEKLLFLDYLSAVYRGSSPQAIGLKIVGGEQLVPDAVEVYQ